MASDISAVLFDLDDTLSDHIGSVRAGLVGTKTRHIDLFATAGLADMEQLHSDILEATHLRLLAGELTMAEARVERTQAFFATFGVQLTESEAQAEYDYYRAEYDAAAAEVAGATALLDELATNSIRLGIITNNLVAAQHKKLHHLDMFDRFEMLTISEEVGVAKPDRLIFEVALERMALQPDQVVMVGDSLVSDVAGALAAGVSVVWLDRHGLGPAHAPRGIQAVISKDLADTPACIAAILG